MKKWLLKDWLSFLENRHVDEIQLGLDRVRAVAQNLDILNPKARVILIGGTNGKGSTVACLEEIYLKAQYRVASFTSPHLIHFNERIKIDQQPISDNKLCELFEEVEKARGDILLTFFEVTTLVALLYFKVHEPDIILLEVGMGGRLDATNIIEPDLSIITTIAADHQKYLGNSLENIAIEKSGIMRANKPVIYLDNIVLETISLQAKKCNAQLFLLERDFSCKITQQKKHNNTKKTVISSGFNVTMGSESVSYVLPNIHIRAALGAVIAINILRKYLKVTQEQIDAALKEVSINARLQYIPGKINLLLDVAHNVQAVLLLNEAVKLVKNDNCKVHGVFSALKDKDLSGLIENIGENVDYWYPVVMDTKRASKESDILNTINFSQAKCSFCFKNALDAFKSALKCAKIGDLIVVYGSFLLVGEILQYINENKALLNERSLNEILS